MSSQGFVAKAKDFIDQAIHPEHRKPENRTDPAFSSVGTAGPGMTGIGAAGHDGPAADYEGGRSNVEAHAGHFHASELNPRHPEQGDVRLGGHGTTTAGPHGSNLANKADPRVDSDLDGSRKVGTGSGLTTGTAGPHSSNLANKADPRVDSNLDGSRQVGTGSGVTTGTGSGVTAGTAGPHSSNLANKLDPRVDSDRDGSRNAGFDTTDHSSHGHAGVLGHSGTSGITGYSGEGTTTGLSGSGPAPNTAGPHGSDLLNKADPRVDSNRDGSKTAGGNQTYQ